MTGREEKEETSFKIVFNGEDEGWQDYHDKFKAFGEYKKWWTALKADATGDETEEKKTTRKKARYALIMSTKGDAAEYVRAEPDPYYGWLSLMERYDKKDGNDLKSLYKKWDGRARIERYKTLVFEAGRERSRHRTGWRQRQGPYRVCSC